MPMRITMLQTRNGEAGVGLLAAGSTYTVSDAFGAQMVGSKFATDTDGVLRPAVSALTPAAAAAVQALVSRAGIVASDTGSDWLGAPSLLSFSTVLDSGTATTVLLEVRDAAGTVATAATITADTIGQVLRQSLLLRQQSEYRFRRSSGTGTVIVTV